MQIIRPNDPNYVNTETYQRYTQLLSYADLMDDVRVKFKPVIIPTAPPVVAYITTENQTEVININQPKYVIVNELISAFNFTIDGIVNAVTFKNYYDVTSYNNCYLTLTASNGVTSTKTTIYVTESATFTAPSNNTYTFYYYNTGSLVLGISDSTSVLPITSFSGNQELQQQLDTTEYLVVTYQYVDDGTVPTGSELQTSTQAFFDTVYKDNTGGDITSTFCAITTSVDTHTVTINIEQALIDKVWEENTEIDLYTNVFSTNDIPVSVTVQYKDFIDTKVFSTDADSDYKIYGNVGAIQLSVNEATGLIDVYTNWSGTEVTTGEPSGLNSAFMLFETGAAALDDTPTGLVSYNLALTSSSDTVVVGDPLNAPYLNSGLSTSIIGTGTYEVFTVGNVAEEYIIGRNEVTVAEYVAFLNAVACFSDAFKLYTQLMPIVRTLQNNKFIYIAQTGKESLPITYVSWLEAARFCNWLHNGKPQVTIAGTEREITEYGAYTLMNRITGKSIYLDVFTTIRRNSSGFNVPTQTYQWRNIQRNPTALWYIPSISEWFKAAYYKGGTQQAGYWEAPDQTDGLTESLLSLSSKFNVSTGQIRDTRTTSNVQSVYGVREIGGNIEEITDTKGWSAFNNTVMYSVNRTQVLEITGLISRSGVNVCGGSYDTKSSVFNLFARMNTLQTGKRVPITEKTPFRGFRVAGAYNFKPIPTRTPAPTRTQKPNPTPPPTPPPTRTNTPTPTPTPTITPTNALAVCNDLTPNATLSGTFIGAVAMPSAKNAASVSFANGVLIPAGTYYIKYQTGAYKFRNTSPSWRTVNGISIRHSFLNGRFESVTISETVVPEDGNTQGSAENIACGWTSAPFTHRGGQIGVLFQDNGNTYNDNFDGVSGDASRKNPTFRLFRMADIPVAVTPTPTPTRFIVNQDDCSNDINTTCTVAVNSSQNGIINVGKDSDWWRVVLLQNKTYRVTVTGNTLRDPVLYVRNTSGSQLYYVDDITAPVYSRNPSLTFTALWSGVYFLDVRGYSNSTGTYTVRIEEIVTPPSITPTVTPPITTPTVTPTSFINNIPVQLRRCNISAVVKTNVFSNNEQISDTLYPAGSLDIGVLETYFNRVTPSNNRIVVLDAYTNAPISQIPATGQLTRLGSALVKFVAANNPSRIYWMSGTIIVNSVTLTNYNITFVLETAVAPNGFGSDPVVEQCPTDKSFLIGNGGFINTVMTSIPFQAPTQKGYINQTYVVASTTTPTPTPTPTRTPTITPTRNRTSGYCDDSPLCVSVSGSTVSSNNKNVTYYRQNQGEGASWLNENSLQEYNELIPNDWPLLLKYSPTIQQYYWQYFHGEGIFRSQNFVNPVCPHSIDRGGLCVYTPVTSSYFFNAYASATLSVGKGSCSGSTPTPTRTPTRTPTITPTIGGNTTNNNINGCATSGIQSLMLNQLVPGIDAPVGTVFTLASGSNIAPEVLSHFTVAGRFMFEPIYQSNILNINGTDKRWALAVARENISMYDSSLGYKFVWRLYGFWVNSNSGFYDQSTLFETTNIQDVGCILEKPGNVFQLASVPLPTPTGTPTPTPTRTPTPTPTRTPTPTPTPTRASGQQIQQLFPNYNNSGTYVYRTLGYPISAVLRGFTNPISNGTSTEQAVFNNTLSALDYWSMTLSGTNVSTEQAGTTLYDGSIHQTNPLSGIANTGLLLSVKSYSAVDGTLGFAGVRSQRSVFNRTDTWIPYESYFVINTNYTSTSLTTTPLGKTENYYVLLHEIGHALGLGTMWHLAATPTLYRSYIVGAGDTTPNPLGLGLSANFFYTTFDNGTRTSTQLGNNTSISGTTYNIGDASYTTALDSSHTNLPNTPTYGWAVSAYNSLFSTNLTAIPVENGKGFGSIGAHWDEGVNSDAAYGTDNRAYYGNLTPGAIGLNDELMTPQSEGNGRDIYTSRITLGALRDLGYTVNYNNAEVFNPRGFTVFNINEPQPLQISFYDSGERLLPIYVNGYTSTNTSGKIIYLKRGLSYSFNIISFSGPIKLTSDSTGTTLLTAGVTNNNINSGTIQYSVPTTLTFGTSAWLNATFPEAKALIIIQ